MAQVVDGEEESPEKLLECAQLSYVKAEGWIDHATCTWLESALGLVTIFPQFVPAVGRLLARVGYGWHQGNRSAASVLEGLQAIAERVLQEEQPQLLQYRKEQKLCQLLGEIKEVPVDPEKGGKRASLSIRSHAPSQRAQLGFYGASFEEACRAADIDIFAERNAYDDAVACMLIILAHYLGSRYRSFVSQLGRTGASSGHHLTPPLLLGAMVQRVTTALEDDKDYPEPKSQYIVDPLRAEVVSPTAEAQLALWGEIVEKMGESVLMVTNTFAMQDATSLLPENEYGLQGIRIVHVFSPTRDEASLPTGDDGAEAAPLMFGDMVADAAGFEAAVAAAVAANVRSGDVQEEEHYTKAAQLFTTLPGLGEMPIRILAQMTLTLGYYRDVREKLCVPLLLQRTTTLRGASMECMHYKNAKVQK